MITSIFYLSFLYFNIWWFFKE